MYAKIMLFDATILVDTIRQWFVLICSTCLLALFILALKRIYKTQGRYTFDFLVISIESLKVIKHHTQI